MEDTYLPAFRAAVTEGHAGSVMCAYNAHQRRARLRQPVPAPAHACAVHGNSRAMSCPTAARCTTFSKAITIRASQPQASAISLMRGMDNECITFGEVTGRRRLPAVHRRRAGRAICPRRRSTRHSSDYSPRGCGSACSIRPSMVPYARIDPRRARQSGAPAAGLQPRRKIDGAAQERRRASAARARSESLSSVRSPSRPASCSAIITAIQLTRRAYWRA